MNSNKIIKTGIQSALLLLTVLTLGLREAAVAVATEGSNSLVTNTTQFPDIAQVGQTTPEPFTPDLDQPSPDPTEPVTPGTPPPGTPLETVPTSPDAGTNLPSPLITPPNPLDPSIVPNRTDAEPTSPVPNNPSPLPPDETPTDDRDSN